MTIRNYLRLFRENWLTIVAVGVVGLILGVLVYLISPAQYTATVQLYVSAQTADDPQQAYQGAQLSQQRVKSYTQLVNSTRVTGQVVSDLRLNTTPEELSRSITATSATDSVIIDVSATAGTPDDATRIADSTGRVFTQLVDELEKPNSPNSVSPVAIRLVQQAIVPIEKSSLGLAPLMLIGLVAGVALAAAATTLRSYLDQTVKSVEGLKDALPYPVIGSTQYYDNASEQPLVVQMATLSPAAENFRQIRTNLQFINVDRPLKVIMVTSSVSGEGKTTTLSNLGVALAQSGFKVLILDADLRKPKMSSVFHVDGEIGLTNLLSGRLPLRQATQRYAPELSLDVVTSGPIPPNPSELLASQNMKAILQEARDAYDYVLVDTPPILPVTDATALATSVDCTILVHRYGKVKSSQLGEAANALETVSAYVAGTVLTIVPKSASTKSDYYYQNGESITPNSAFVRPLKSNMQEPSTVTHNYGVSDGQGSRPTPSPRPSRP